MAENRAVVDGIGGVFIYANDAKALSDWYVRHLGLPLGTWEEGKNYGAQLPSASSKGGDDAESIIFSIQAAPKSLGADRNQVTVNYRVRDLAGLKSQLRSDGVAIEKEEDSEYGGFAWVRDPEGNKIELYQPAG
jgi:catechol 2,3-dioxygenase-like lactoylglutathione lyase family enzyme